MVSFVLVIFVIYLVRKNRVKENLLDVRII